MTVLLILLAWVLLVAALAVPAAPGVPLEQRYRRLAGVTLRATRRRSLGWVPVRPLLPLLPRGYRDGLRSLLLQAHLTESWTLIDLVALKFVCSAAFLLAGTAFWLKTAMPVFAYVIPLQAAAGWILPEFWIKRRIVERRAAVTRELPQMLSGLAICLHTGLSLRSAVAELSLVLEGSVLGDELRAAAVHLNRGATPDEALSLMIDRCGSEELTRALGAVLQQAPKSPMAAGVAAATEARLAWQRRRRRAESLAQSASIRLFLPQLLLGLPALLLIIMGPALLAFVEAFRSFR